MSTFRDPPRTRAIVLFTFTLGYIALASPARVVWVQSSLPWWLPFVVWGGVIVVGGISASWWARGGRP
ncbi:MAG: hypothetical protein AAFZ18_21995 [Myxococcota bacterium]